MSYRPICDTWILARPKVKWYGAYPSGFLERGRALLGVMPQDAVLHVCGGRARDYPFRGFGPNDVTLDADPNLKPDILADVNDLIPLQGHRPTVWDADTGRVCLAYGGRPWPAILADPAYSVEDQANYDVGAELYPEPRKLLADCLRAVRPGGRVGFLHYIWPRPPAPSIGFKTRSVAVITVLMGFGNRGRLFSVYERLGDDINTTSTPVDKSQSRPLVMRGRRR